MVHIADGGNVKVLHSPQKAARHFATEHQESAEVSSTLTGGIPGAGGHCFYAGKVDFISMPTYLNGGETHLSAPMRFFRDKKI